MTEEEITLEKCRAKWNNTFTLNLDEVGFLLHTIDAMQDYIDNLRKVMTLTQKRD